MKQFESGDSWNSLNWVDENNVVLGYDFSQSCCEDFGYYFTRKESNTVLNYEGRDSGYTPDLEKYNFDPEYHKYLEGDCMDEGMALQFRLVSKDGEERFLVIYNFHNGYYGHGFKFEVGKEIALEGTL